MKLRIKVDEFNIVQAGKGKKTIIEIMAGMEDVFDMMDEMSPKNLADYMMRRMRDCFELKREKRARLTHEYIEKTVNKNGGW